MSSFLATKRGTYYELKVKITMLFIIGPGADYKCRYQ